MRSIEIPPDIDKIFDKPGGDWTPEERDRVLKWLLGNRRLRYLLSFAFRKLQEFVDEVRHNDVEETWDKFYTKRILSIIKNYDPHKGRRFWNYLLFCFERFCQKEGKKNCTQRHREHPLPQIETEEEEHFEFEISDLSDKPDDVLKSKEMLHAMQECINRVSCKRRKVFIMYYFEGQSIIEIAEKCGMSVNNVKNKLCLARQNLKKCLQAEGWIP